MKLKLISCEVFYREMCSALARSPNQVDIEFLPKGLHDLGASEMRARVQAVVDAVDTSQYDAIIMGYGLCNNGLHGIVAPAIPMVFPRAHDCITLFLGGKERYLEYFNLNPGTYFKTSGWIERGTVGEDLKQLSIGHLTGMDQSFEELVAQYGEDNAQYLYETLCNETKNYGQYTFIEMGVEPDDRFEDQTRREAKERGWTFKKEKGDMSLIQRLVDGHWGEEDFLAVHPGQRVKAKYDEGIIASEDFLGETPGESDR